MRTVLLTGSTGALGNAVAARLRMDGRFRVVRARRQPDDQDSVQFDALRPSTIADAIGLVQPDLVLHLAATLSGDFETSFSVNVAASRHLLEAVQKLVPRSRVLLVGSAAEYGLVEPSENPIREDRLLRPVSTYGLTKAWQSHLVSVFAARNVDVVEARIFNLQGPGISEKLFVGRVQQQLAAVLSGRQEEIHVGPLDAVRDYISTDDAANKLLAIADLGASGQVYHVASGQPISMRKLLDRMLAAHDLDFAIVRVDHAPLSNKGVETPIIYADMSKTSKLISAGKTAVDD